VKQHAEDTGPATKLAAGVACFLGLAGVAAFGGLILVLGTGWQPSLMRAPDPWPWGINLAWLVIFGAQHSGMARQGFKRWWTTLVPAYLERSVYVGVSGLLALAMAATWQPIDGNPLWQGPRWLSAIPVLAAIGAGWVSRHFDQLAFLGLRQAWTAGQTGETERLLVVGPYRYVRHPVMVGLLVLLWVHPVMTPTLALLSGGLTLYIAVGTWLEERDLLQRFGPAYAAYRSRVPALLPWRSPAPAATYPPVG
jgi:protein-S-isoprenylcysteine O-methyltransferase Ste14